MSKCRSCDAPVVWRTTTGGRAMPLDPKPSAEGNVVLEQGGGCRVLAGEERETWLAAGKTLYMPHWGTCPQAHEWRRP